MDFKPQTVAEEPPTAQEQKDVAYFKENCPEGKDVFERNPALLLQYTRGFIGKQFSKFPHDVAREKTLKVVKRRMEWRKECKVDGLASRVLPRTDEFTSLFSAGVSGTDKRGRPIWIVHPFDDQLMKKFTPAEAGKQTVQQFERLVQMKAAASAKAGRLIYTHNVVLDMYDGKWLGKRKIMYLLDMVNWSPSDAPEEKINVVSWFYPDSLHKTYIINAPFSFRTIWFFAKKFMHKVTAAKFEIIGSDYRSTFVKNGVPLDQLPRYMGGSGEDPRAVHYIAELGSGQHRTVSKTIGKGETLMYEFWTPHAAPGVVVEGHFRRSGEKFREGDKGDVICKISVPHSKHIVPAGQQDKFESTAKGVCSFVIRNTGHSKETVRWRVMVASPPATRDPPEVEAKWPAAESIPMVKKPEVPLAPPVVKRGSKLHKYHQSVVDIDDFTPFHELQGWLDKNRYWQWNRCYFAANNEYLNYWLEEPELDPETKRPKLSPLGSYSLNHATKIYVDPQDSKGRVIRIDFDDGSVKTLRAQNNADASRWACQLEERRKWFVGINTAFDSKAKMEAQEAEARKRNSTDNEEGVKTPEDLAADANGKSSALTQKFVAGILVLLTLSIVLLYFLGVPGLTKHSEL